MNTLPSAAQQFLDIISSTCRNSLNLIGELLNVEYLVALQTQVKLERMDLISRMQQRVDAFQLSRSSNKKKTPARH